MAPISFLPSWWTRGDFGFSALALLVMLVTSGWTLYENGASRLESHGQKIASEFPNSLVGVEKKPIPKYSEIRKRVVLHNRQASLLEISSLEGRPPGKSWEVLVKDSSSAKADLTYEDGSYRFGFSLKQSLGFFDYVLYGGTSSGAISALVFGGLSFTIVLFIWGFSRPELPPEVPTFDLSTEEIIQNCKPEGKHLEFKEVLRWNSQKGGYSKDTEHRALKNITSFINTEGGTLLVGVTDDINPNTEEKDLFENVDEAKKHLENILRKISPNPVKKGYIENVDYNIVDGHRILRIDCRPGKEPAFLTDKRPGKEEEERFYVRGSASSPELKGNEITGYIEDHFD